MPQKIFMYSPFLNTRGEVNANLAKAKIEFENGQKTRLAALYELLEKAKESPDYEVKFIPIRLFNCLRNSDSDFVETFGSYLEYYGEEYIVVNEIAKRDFDYFIRIPNCGKVSIKLLVDRLNEFGVDHKIILPSKRVDHKAGTNYQLPFDMDKRCKELHKALSKAVLIYQDASMTNFERQQHTKDMAFAERILNKYQYRYGVNKCSH